MGHKKKVRTPRRRKAKTSEKANTDQAP